MKVTFNGEEGYIYLVDAIAPGQAITQYHIHTDYGILVLDFNKEGQLLGIETWSPELLHPDVKAMAQSDNEYVPPTAADYNEPYKGE